MKHTRLLGFFSLFALYAVPGLLAGDWGQAIWLVWLVWAVYFFVDLTESKKQDGTQPEAGDTSSP